MSESDFVTNITCEKELPIFHYRDEIVKKIRNNSVIIINGTTGSGKTTQVPQFILDDAIKRKEKCKIIVSQPRKIAAMSIAKRVAIERKCHLGSLVGYQVGLDKKLDKTNFTTNIIFCTTGIILQKLIHVQGIENFTHIILDEIHERDIDTDLLITIIRNHLLEMTCDAKIILMSATINVERFLNYFTLSVNSKEFLTLEQQKQRIIREEPNKIIICEPKVIMIETDKKKTQYKVEIKYLNELSSISFGASSSNLKCPSIPIEMYSLAAKLVILYLRENDDKSVLIFLPGIYEIESAHAILANCSELKEKCMLYVLHSLLPASEQKEIFRASTLPKVILTTNIAESSVTLPNVGCIIDFCLTKSIVGSESSLSSLKLEWATKHSCIQRAGRTGRVCDGKVFRLVDKWHYNNFVEEIIPEMVRAPLETVVLRVKLISTAPPHIFLNQTMNAPKMMSVFKTVMILKELGGLTMFGRDGQFISIDGDLTLVGRIMALLPIDVRLAKLVALGWLFSVLSDTIIIASGLSVKNLFKNHFDKKMYDYTQKLYWANGSCCDSIAILNAYRFWQHAVERGDLKNLEDEQNFCYKYNFERKALHEMRRLIHEIENRIGELILENNVSNMWNQRETHFIIKLCIAGAFMPNYYMQRETEEIDERNASKILCGLNPYQTVYFRKMDFTRIGDLYVEQIKEKLVSEGIIESENNVDISFDCSKILIQFLDSKALIDDEDYNCDAKRIQKRTIFPGMIPQEIYMSIFFRKYSMHRNRLQKKRYDFKQSVNSSLDLHVLNSKFQEEEYAIEQGLGEMVNGSFQLKKQYISSPEKCILPTFSTKNIQGFVTHVEHCNNFYFQPQNGSEVYVEELETKLTFEKFTNVDYPQKGMMVIVLHERKYKRARIDMVIDYDKVVDCFMIDYGYTLEFPFSDILTLSKEKIEKYFSLSERCLDCTLTGIFPSYIKCPRGKWTQNSIHLFRQMVHDKQCEIQVYSVVNDKVSVILYANGVNINDYMVEQNYARIGEESYISRINHYERQNIQYSLENWITRDVEFKTKVNKLLKKSVKAPPINECNRIIQIEGPFSPLETNIGEITLRRNGVVTVNPQSVNNIILNDSLEKGNHGKLLIAADVLTNSSEDSISLYNVTVMPNINGLPAILAMIFAPYAAFYRDDEQNIVKVRFGVGKNSENFEAIFYEHDCILPINFEIVDDDIQNINELRSCMSQLYNEAFSIKDFDKKECKSEVKSLVSKIFSKERPIIHRSANISTIIDKKWPQNDEDYLIIARSAFEKPYIPKAFE
ncbi:hypothetical protein PVAND_013615 [Polypedilum vanderplanki]|uniref:Probable ATP-dependent RNA helicase spindle-E n=1 Tax=Polypedilum vanderplanki TaxID=319348 RepID=A0A9J6CR75_POLVA|nr:hypothetical protein PVAND_013615 [Polypedilum vanderplanki]